MTQLFSLGASSMIYRIFLLAVLVRLLIASDKPFLCSALYAGVIFIFGLIVGPFLAALISAGIAFLLTSIYFWLLDRFDSSPLLWWLIAVAGIPITYI